MTDKTSATLRAQRDASDLARRTQAQERRVPPPHKREGRSLSTSFAARISPEARQAAREATRQAIEQKRATMNAMYEAVSSFSLADLALLQGQVVRDWKAGEVDAYESALQLEVVETRIEDVLRVESAWNIPTKLPGWTRAERPQA